MRPTYRKAALVLTWMGNDPDTINALKVLRGIAQNIEVMKTENLLWLGAMGTLCDVQYWAQPSEERPHDSTGNYLWDILTKFTSHSYWTRSWIVQEIVLGKRVLLVAGDEAMNLDDLDDFTGQLREFQMESRTCPRFVQPQIWQIISANFYAWMKVRNTTNMRWQHQRGKLGSWNLDIIIHTRSQKATDPRDKVFSMLGLAHMGIVADYSRPVESVYCEFAEKWLAKRKPLEHLLIHSGCGHHEAQIVELPSWVPDWSSVSTFVPSNFDPSLYSAGGNQHFFQMFSPFLGPFVFGSMLRTCGVVASTVKSIGNINGRSLDGSKQHWQFCTDYLARKGTEKYPTGIPSLQALFRVVLRDRDGLKTNQLLKTTSPTFYTLALGFLRTIIETVHYASGRHIDQTLAICLPQLGLSTGSRFAEFFSKNFLGGKSPYVEAWASAENAIVAHPAILNGLMAAMTVIHAENSDKRFFETANGLLGLGPRGMRESDVVGIFGGCNLPVVLRRVDDHFLFVGSCFVLGLMGGEALNLETLGELGGLEVFDIW
jgi:hypothetical protein